MKKIIFFTIISVLFYKNSFSGTLNGDTSFIKNWAGKYAYEKIDGKSLWDNKIFKNEIKKILQKKERYELIDIVKTGPESEVTNYGGVLVFNACERHNCPGFNIAVLYEQKNNILHVCWHCGSEYIWFTSGGKQKVMKDGTCFETNYNEMIRKYVY